MLYLNFLKCCLTWDSHWLTCFTCKVILLLVTFVILGTVLGSAKRGMWLLWFPFLQMNSSSARMTRIIACQRAWMSLITLWLKLAAHSAHSRKYVSNSTSITWSRGSSSLLWITVSFTLTTILSLPALPSQTGTCSENLLYLTVKQTWNTGLRFQWNFDGT